MIEPRPGERAGEYELLQLLGIGGMAEVWLARRRGPGKFERKVVIKRILRHHLGDETFVKMFVAEARLSARLAHPNIVAVHELGEQDGLYYIVMEYVRGRDLRAVLAMLQGGSPPTPGLGAYIGRELALALGYAHDVTDDDGKRLRLVHRDVSPSNVVLSFDGNVKLVDFGIAKALDDAQHEHTRTGSLKGKIGYMAPEQLGEAASSTDHRADLWAAGVVLWETLTGRRLFRGLNEVHTLDLVRSSVIEPPSTGNPAVPAELDRIVLKALSRDLDARYQTGHELAHDLEQVVAALRFGAPQLSQLMRASFEEDTAKISRVVADSSSVVADTANGTGDAPKAPTPAPVVAPRRTKRVVAAAAAVVAVLVGLFVARARFHDEPIVTAAAPAPQPAPVASHTGMKLHIDTRPHGALVFFGSEEAPRGETPLDANFPSGTAPIAVRAVLQGYVTARGAFVPDHDDTLFFPLASEPAPVAMKRKR